MKEFVEHTYDDVGRIYHFSDGSQYYSVTTMLGATKDKKFLDEWRQRVGQKRAEGLTRIAGVIGGDMHSCAEKYLLKQDMSFPNAVVRNLFNQIKPFIDKRVVKVYRTEEVLWSDDLQLAGSCDAIVDYLVSNDPFYTVLDFKTANKQPKIEWVRDYFLQLSTYSLMIEKIFGRQPSKGALLFAYKQKRSPYNEVVINPRSYTDEVKRRVDMFQTILKVIK